MLHVSVSRHDGVAVLRLAGELDYGSAEQLRETIRALSCEDSPAAEVVVDADDVTFLDASGLAPLLELRQALPSARIRLRASSRPVLRVVHLLELENRLGLEP